MSDTKFANLEEYKAYIDAKYRGETPEQIDRAQRDAERRRKDRWLLINPTGVIDGVLASHCAQSETEAFEEFYPRKADRLRAAREGYRIERDDEHGSRFNAWSDSLKAAGQ